MLGKRWVAPGWADNPVWRHGNGWSDGSGVGYLPWTKIVW